MRVRELIFQNFRGFHGRHRISFVDPATDVVRPVSALVGADASARETVLEAIEALLSYAIDPRHPRPLVEEALKSGWIQMSLELTPRDLEHFYGASMPEDLPSARVLRIEVGKRGVAPLLPVHEWSTLLAFLAPRHGDEESFTNAGSLSSQLYTAVARMHRGADLRGGLLYFPGAPEGVEGKAQPGLGQDVDQAATWIVRAKAPLKAGHADVDLVGDAEAAVGQDLDRLGRPGAVIALGAAALSTLPASQSHTMDRLREVVRDWDAQLILDVSDEEDLPGFREDEQVRLHRPV